MTPSEFKAWFDGFTEAFSGCPTKAQWARIKERVAEIDGKPVTERIYVDRYWPSLPSPSYPYWRYTTIGNVVGNSAFNTQYQQSVAAQNLSNQATTYNSMSAMANLGRAEGKALS